MQGINLFEVWYIVSYLHILSYLISIMILRQEWISSFIIRGSQTERFVNWANVITQLAYSKIGTGM